MLHNLMFSENLYYLTTHMWNCSQSADISWNRRTRHSCRGSSSVTHQDVYELVHNELQHCRQEVGGLGSAHKDLPKDRPLRERLIQHGAANRKGP